MKTQAQLIKMFGDPSKDNLTFEHGWMVLWIVPETIRAFIPALPMRMYVNKLIKHHLEATFLDLIDKELHREIKTYDGCFNIRKKRGLVTLSMHAFGLAIDLNAAWNQLGKKVTWSNAFVEVWRKNGWTCGADWQGRVDGMHFQWDKF